MNYTEQLLAGMSRFNTDLIAADVGCDADKFAEIIDLVHQQSLVSLRAAWVMTVVTDKYLDLINPYISVLIDNIPSHNHPGITRMVLRVLSRIDIPQQYLGVMFNYSCNWLENEATPVAIKVYAMQIMYNISQLEPDLKPELILLIEAHLNHNTAAYNSRSSKLINKLRKEIYAKK
jgi:hypothetical protein